MSDASNLASKALDLAEKIRARSDELGDADLKLHAADLQLALTALQARVGDTAEEPDYRGDMYFFADRGPYCVNCWDNERRKVHLAPLERSLIGMGRFQCPRCNSFYKGLPSDD